MNTSIIIKIRVHFIKLIHIIKRRLIWLQQSELSSITKVKSEKWMLSITTILHTSLIPHFYSEGSGSSQVDVLQVKIEVIKVVYRECNLGQGSRISYDRIRPSIWKWASSCEEKGVPVSRAQHISKISDSQYIIAALGHTRIICIHKTHIAIIQSRIKNPESIVHSCIGICPT